MYMSPNNAAFYPIALRPSLCNVNCDVIGKHSIDMPGDCWVLGENASLQREQVYWGHLWRLPVCHLVI